ncbi:GSCFA domain-containing protein [Flavobacterium silvisoli]|uniref:GSCFA domain-containing protein n=1 Tax=Flavobacterium silvisoli TaxID=2529433 RepID=A0A4Q9YPM9_9FLAO|nr:GSCFA domain-containing protein [Flavobacterium silvisoli]TBX65370.1 GSCFA domain-containing protein [Flavobacterium silvisoli]
MQFSTSVPIPKNGNPIDYHSKIVSLGSCFAENMAAKFEYFKFRNTVNPFGIIFNPVSIEKLVLRAVNQEFFTDEDIFFYNDLWHSYEVHSELSQPDKGTFLNNLNQKVTELHLHISNATHILITYGTSWVYKLKATEQLVANCHKVPQNQFDKEILSVAVIEQSIQNTIDLIRKLNPDCHFTFTVSPVRHLKDGFVENQRSKAHLITAIHNLSFANTASTFNYFPSYEILMDELRDYRFYAEDMLHPNPTAIDYIWQRFAETQITENSYPVMEEVDALQKGLAHRPFNPNSENHLKFLHNLNQKIIRLQERYPHMQF